MRKQDGICGRWYAHTVSTGVLTHACVYTPEIILQAVGGGRGLSAGDARSQRRRGELRVRW